MEVQKPRVMARQAGRRGWCNVGNWVVIDSAVSVALRNAVGRCVRTGGQGEVVDRGGLHVLPGYSARRAVQLTRLARLPQGPSAVTHEPSLLAAIHRSPAPASLSLCDHKYAASRTRPACPCKWPGDDLGAAHGVDEGLARLFQRQAVAQPHAVRGALQGATSLRVHCICIECAVLVSRSLLWRRGPRSEQGWPRAPCVALDV